MPGPSRLQRLINSAYLAYKRASLEKRFACQIQSEDEAAVAKVLKSIKLEDVGLAAHVMDDLAEKITEHFWRVRRGWAGSSPWSSSFKGKNQQNGPAHFLHVCRHELFEVALIVMPKGSWLPLHDHPGMSVFTKVLHGRLRVTSFDFVEQFETEEEGKRTTLASARDGVVRSSGTLTPSDAPLVLSPSAIHRALLTPPHFLSESGSIHEFSADETTAFLDVMGPPYTADSRKCHYYDVTHSPRDELPVANGRERKRSREGAESEEGAIPGYLPGSKVVLKEIPVPRTYYSSTSPYGGPPVEVPSE
mmetsp:Transcript_5636/g.13139  ORF Transcript_5636/g.13139 Transcript_5636/m.13139 type:complete len:305 (+) Transcript_5636:264-1178(+)